VRSVLREVFGWSHVDAGEGWLIFALPRGEVGVHPADASHHELSLTCDDIVATVSDLRARGIEFKGEPESVGWGVAATMVLPGGLEVLLYEPRHPTAT